MKHPLKWYKPGKVIKVSDKMQTDYEYTLTARAGKDFDKSFTPYLTPGEMLAYGVFEGKYLNDCTNEFPLEWYEDAAGKLSEVADEKINLFGIKSRLSLQEWREKGWIPIVEGDNDVRGWFQWYCRYWIGRRDPVVDAIQIARWRAFTRHKGQVVNSIKEMKKSDRPVTRAQLMNHRPRQRQALLQWAYNPFVKK